MKILIAQVNYSRLSHSRPVGVSSGFSHLKLI